MDADYLVGLRAALDVAPTQSSIVIERFFDESGGMQLVIHSPYGVRIPIARGWPCASASAQFNFELQAAATETRRCLRCPPAQQFHLISVSR